MASRKILRLFRPFCSDLVQPPHPNNAGATSCALRQSLCRSNSEESEVFALPIHHSCGLTNRRTRLAVHQRPWQFTQLLIRSVERKRKKFKIARYLANLSSISRCKCSAICG